MRKEGKRKSEKGKVKAAEAIADGTGGFSFFVFPFSFCPRARGRLFTDMPEPSEHSESGQPIYHYKEPKQRKLQPATGDADNIEAIARHIEKHIGPPNQVFHEIVSDIVHIDVHLVAPTPARNYYTLVTSGMSERPMHVPEGAEELRYGELSICLPPTWKLDQESFKDEQNYWPVRWLKVLARFPHEYETWLGEGHTIPTGDPPEPYAKNTKFCCMLLAGSALADEGFDTLELSDRNIHFWSLIPLYVEEMNYKLKQGFEPLLEKLSKVGGPDELEVVHINRRNACGKRFWIF
jgi:hypothetical protein